MASSAPPILEKLIAPLGDCLTLESAQKIMDLKADSELQEHIHELGRKCTSGELSEEEREEYETVVRFTDFVSILQSKARKMIRAVS